MNRTVNKCYNLTMEWFGVSAVKSFTIKKWFEGSNPENLLSETNFKN